MLEFEPEEHVYKFDGKVVQSVTQILEPIKGYDGIPPDVLARAAERGNAVHKLCENYDYGQLDPEALKDPVYGPYLSAWIDFLTVSGCEVEIVEYQMYHPKLGYAGTLDRILRTPRGKRIMADIKATSTFMPSVGPQTAGYDQIWQANNDRKDWCKERWCIRLRKNGEAELTVLKDRSDYSTFNSCLNIARWKEEHYG